MNSIKHQLDYYFHGSSYLVMVYTNQTRDYPYFTEKFRHYDFMCENYRYLNSQVRDLLTRYFYKK